MGRIKTRKRRKSKTTVRKPREKKQTPEQILANFVGLVTAYMDEFTREYWIKQARKRQISLEAVITHYVMSDFRMKFPSAKSKSTKQKVTTQTKETET